MGWRAKGCLYLYESGGKQRMGVMGGGVSKEGQIRCLRAQAK